MGRLTVRIGGDGPVVAESHGASWRLIVRGDVHASGAGSQGLHAALRELALSDRALAHEAFGVICNCAGSWEDEYTEVHGDGALGFEEWMERVEYGGITWFDDEDGELKTSVRVD